MMAIRYPWTKLQKGEGFFVPALNLKKARELGLRAAVSVRIQGQAMFVIKDGLIGVWFYR